MIKEPTFEAMPQNVARLEEKVDALTRSLVPLNEQGTYALAGETKMTVAIDSERQVAWCNDNDVPRNAFNLVRHYRFGELDTNIKDGAAIKRLPSYKAMLKLCREDVAVRKNLIHGIGTHETNVTDDWELTLTLNDNNQIEKTGQNIKLILLNDSKLSKVRFDRFTKRDITQCPDFCNERDNRIDDESVGKICLYLENQYGLQLSQPPHLEMLKTTSKERGFNPVQNFIMSDSWDYVERIDTVVIRYLGSEDTPLTRAQTRKWMIGAVARAFAPGCKFDHILTFTGPQGVGKSTFLSIISGEWFSDSFSFAHDDKTKIEDITGAWIVEISELNGMKRAHDAEAAKAFLSRVRDDVRPAYARYATAAGDELLEEIEAFINRPVPTAYAGWPMSRPDADGEMAMFIRIQKTQKESIHPLSPEMLALCGERDKGIVFKGFNRSMTQEPLKKWLKAAGITKRITFHHFRDTFATLQLAAGTDIYTVRKMLDHANVTTTQIYARLVDSTKRDTVGRIKLT